MELFKSAKAFVHSYKVLKSPPLHKKITADSDYSLSAVIYCTHFTTVLDMPLMPP